MHFVALRSLLRVTWPAALFALTGCGSQGTGSELGSTQDLPMQAPPLQAALPDTSTADGPRIPSRQRLSRETKDLPRELLPGGMKRIDLQHRFGHLSVAKRQPDGSLKSECIDRVEQFDRALAGQRGVE